MKKIALISSFCNSQEKLDVLYKNVKIIKDLKIDVIIFTPFSLPEKINQLADYILISKENPVFDWPVKAYYQWSTITIGNKQINMSRTYPDYGYASLIHIKRMADLALSMNYDLFFPMIYDTHITEEVKNILLDNKPNSFFPSKRENTVWDIGLHLISLDRYHLNNFKNLITPESYLTEKSGEAFSWTHKAIKFIPAIIENVNPIEDLIYNFNEFDFFNYSITDDYKLFIHKTDYDNIKLLFYNFEGSKTFNILSDNFEKEFILNSWDFIELPFNDCSLLKINNIDYTKDIKSIGQNILEINSI
jgi:hypothetical protein